MPELSLEDTVGPLVAWLRELDLELGAWGGAAGMPLSLVTAGTLGFVALGYETWSHGSYNRLSEATAKVALAESSRVAREKALRPEIDYLRHSYSNERVETAFRTVQAHRIKRSTQALLWGLILFSTVPPPPSPANPPTHPSIHPPTHTHTRTQAH